MYWKRIKLLVFVRRRRLIDCLKSLIIASVVKFEFTVYFLSLHAGLALLDQSLASPFRKRSRGQEPEVPRGTDLPQER